MGLLSHNKGMSETLRIAAADSGYDRRVRELGQSVRERFRYHSIELPDGGILPGLQSVEHLRWRLSLFGLPEDLRGMRVLDIGAWDGWFSFECERRGAEVVAVDCVELDTFLEARELLASRVEYQALDVAELSAKRLGRFDIVLFLGVLYHLRHPLLGLEKVVELCTGMALVESFVIAPESRAVPSVMEFYERGELGGQVDNWWGPSPECLLAMCRSAGFAQTELRDVTNGRASVVCRRHWPQSSTDSLPDAHLVSAVSNRS
jgi:tRNA (mo5U34)-methyltransferase